MFTNKLLLLGMVGSLAVGCSSDDRANAASNDEAMPAAAPVAASSPKHKSTAKKTTKTTTTRSASKTTSKTTAAAKPATTSKSAGAPAALVLKVPSASLPPVGKCRVWKAGASQQAQSRSCDGIVSTAPAGSMILDRASKTETKVVRVRYVDAKKAGQVVKVRVFTTSGKYLWDEKA